MLMGRFGREMLRSAAHRPFLHEAISGVLRNLIVHRCAQPRPVADIQESEKRPADAGLFF